MKFTPLQIQVYLIRLYNKTRRFSMIYRWRDMIYGKCRMIYLLRRYDILSVPTYAKRISSAKQISYPEGISPVPQGTDIIVKNHFCPVDKSGFLHVLGRHCDSGSTLFSQRAFYYEAVRFVSDI